MKALVRFFSSPVSTVFHTTPTIQRTSVFGQPRFMNGHIVHRILKPSFFQNAGGAEGSRRKRQGRNPQTPGPLRRGFLPFPTGSPRLPEGSDGTPAHRYGERAHPAASPPPGSVTTLPSGSPRGPSVNGLGPRRPARSNRRRPAPHPPSHAPGRAPGSGAGSSPSRRPQPPTATSPRRSAACLLACFLPSLSALPRPAPPHAHHLPTGAPLPARSPSSAPCCSV